MKEFVITLPEGEAKALRTAANLFGWEFEKLCENFDFVVGEENRLNPLEPSISYVVRLPQDGLEVFSGVLAAKSHWKFTEFKSGI